MTAESWTPERARHARQAAVHAWQEITGAGGSPQERAHAWRSVERALAREAEIAAAQPEPEPEASL